MKTMIDNRPLEILALQSGGYEVSFDNEELTRFTEDDEALNYALSKAFCDGFYIRGIIRY